MIIAYGSNIVVQIPTTQSSTTKSGLYIPEGTSTQGNQVVAASVISVGPTVGIGAWNAIQSKLTINEGDTVWFQKPNSVEFECDDEKYQVIPDNAILALTAKP